MDSIEQRHQEVRAFVEGRYPGCSVTEIVERARTGYKKKLHSDEYILASMDVDFEVQTLNEDESKPSVKCTVLVTADGTLRVGDASYMLYGW